MKKKNHRPHLYLGMVPIDERYEDKYLLLMHEAYAIYEDVIMCQAKYQSSEYNLYLLALAHKLHNVSKLVMYTDDLWPKKFSENEYWQYLFEGYVESEKEFVKRLNQFHLETNEYTTYKIYNLVKRATSHLIQSDDMMYSISEYAILVDYIISHKGKLPYPKYDYPCQPYPVNWKDYLKYKEEKEEELSNAFRRSKL